MRENTKPLRINWQLFPIKLLYFFAISAIGTLIPFITVYMKELGLSSTETGILYGVVPFISFFTRPVIGAFSDKIRHHKAVLMGCYFAMALFYGLLLVIPRSRTDCTMLVKYISNCVINTTGHKGCVFFWNSSFTGYDRKTCLIDLDCSESTIPINRTVMIAENIDTAGCSAEATIKCFQSSKHAYACSVIPEMFGRTFIMFIVIYLFACIPFSSVYSLMDAIAYDILGIRRELWGRQRLWGTIGYAIFALGASFIIDMRSGDSFSSHVDYSTSFFMFIGLCVISAIVTSRLTVSESLHCKHLILNIAHLFQYPEIVAFMIVITFIGMFFAVIQGFAFWYLQDLGSTQLILGLCLFTNCAAEMIIFAFTDKIIKRIGHTACLYLALFAYVVRLLCFSVLSSAWQAPFIELTHGLCFGLMYAAATEYASIISPKGMSATVQGVVGGLYFGLGRGVGGLITGKLFDSKSGLGAVWTFRLYGFIALGVLLTYWILNSTVFKKPIAAHAPRSTSWQVDETHSDTDVQVTENLFSENHESKDKQPPEG